MVFYERLVKAVKTPLRKVLGKALVSLIEMQTLVVEIENVVNNRPLTPVGDGTEEGPHHPNDADGT